MTARTDIPAPARTLDAIRGFTLAELVVASTITALLATGTVAMLRSSAAVQGRVAGQSEVQWQARWAVDAVAGALRNAWLAGENDLAIEGVDGWAGDLPADRIRFFTVRDEPVRLAQPESDVKECEFFLARPDERAAPALVRRLDPTRNERPDGGGVLEGLAEGIVGFDVTYHDGREWVDEWPAERKGWPLAIRVRVLAADPSGEPGGRPWSVSRLVAFPTRMQPGQARQPEQEDAS